MDEFASILLPAFGQDHASSDSCIGCSFAPGGSWDSSVFLMRRGDDGDGGNGGDGALVCSYNSNVRSLY